MRKNPETSHEAFRALDPEKISELHREILRALTELKLATTEKVAQFLGKDHSKVWRRFTDLEAKGLIHRPGNKFPLSTGRMGFMWAPGKAHQETKKKERVMKGKTVSDFSKAIRQVSPSPYITEKLF